MISRKNILILIAILSGLSITLAVFNLDRSSIVRYQKAQILDTKVSPEESSTVQAPDFKPQKLVSKRVLDFSIASDGKGVIYVDDAGNVGQVSFDGLNKQNVQKLTIPISDANFSPDGKSVIESLGVANSFWYYDLANHKSAQLHPALKYVAFSPDSSKIIYHFFEDEKEEGNISVSQPDGRDYRILFKTKIYKLKLFWPNAENILFYPLVKDVTDLFSLKTDGSNFKKVLSSISDPKLFWDHAGRALLIFYGSEGSQNTAVLDTDGGLVKKLESFDPTDCVWALDNQTIYCLKESNILKIDSKTGDPQVFLNLPFNPQRLIFSPLEDYLIVKNPEDNLYSIRIK